MSNSLRLTESEKNRISSLYEKNKNYLFEALAPNEVLITRDQASYTGYGVIFDKTTKKFLRFASRDDSGVQTDRSLDNDPYVKNQLEYIRANKGQVTADKVNAVSTGKVQPKKVDYTAYYAKLKPQIQSVQNFLDVSQTGTLDQTTLNAIYNKLIELKNRPKT